MKKRVLIIGGGIGGLATAALLGKNGFKVDILEKNEQMGGRAGIIKEKGFTFDMGPSWYLMPDVFEHFFKHFDCVPSDFYTLKRLDPAYRLFFDQQRTYDIAADLQQNLNLFESLENNGANKLIAYLHDSQYKYEVAMRNFMYKEYRSFSDILHPRLILEGMSLRIYENIQKNVKRYFRSEIAQKILQYNIVFLGGNPTNTPALYSIMAHIDFNLGVWYPEGGMSGITNALIKLAMRYGVGLHTNTPITHIQSNGKHATGAITTDGRTYEADIIIANADYQYVETYLLNPSDCTYPDSYWESRTVAPSAYILFLGVKGHIPALTHHNLFLEDDWMKHFDDIFKHPRWPDLFSFYVSCPTKTDPSVAPPGHENLFILLPVAPGLQDTPALREKYYEKLVSRIEKTTQQSLQKRIVYKKTFAINDFKNRYNAYRGTALGLSHTLLQSAFFRPRMRSKKLSNLFYAGQYTHPGIGVPTVLIAAEILANEINKSHG